MNKQYYTKKWEKAIIKACKESLSMASACASLRMNKNTFISHAKRIGCYKTNMSGRGIKKKMPLTPLEDILKGKYPEYHTYKLKLRLFENKIKSKKCEVCHKRKWLNKPIPLELHHKDGDSTNHKLNNLQILCPNCHSFTDTYRAKNKK